MNKGIFKKLLIIILIVTLNMFLNVTTIFAEGLVDPGQELDPTPTPSPDPTPSNPDNPEPSTPTPTPEPPKTFKISGSVWEDLDGQGYNLGIFDSGEMLIKGINVSLLKSGTQINTCTTGDNGSYEFSNLENGEYIVNFEYNTQEYNGLNSKSSISPNQKELYNVATDDETTRLNLINNTLEIDSSTINYDTLTLKNGTSTAMLASKAINISNSDVECNFPITKRAQNRISIKKNITHVKVTLSDGSILINWDINDNKQSYVQYIKDNFMTIIMDDEITHGAKLDVTYTITLKSETNKYENLLDYFTPDFIRFNLSDALKRIINNQNLISTQSIPTTYYIYDYLDNNLIFEPNNGWNYKVNNSENDFSHEGDISNLQVLVNQIKIYPGEEIPLQLNVSKMLTISNDTDLNTYENFVEIVKYENSVGNLTYNTDGRLIHPGNLDITNESSINNNLNIEKDAAKAETLSRVPPFGLDLSQTITLIGIIVIIIEIIILSTLKIRIKNLRNKYVRKK